MTREQAKEILNGMSLEGCIKMWNDSVPDHYRRFCEIHEVDDDEWWDRLANELGGYYFMWNLLNCEGIFNKNDEYFLYNQDSCEFISFDNKERLMLFMEDWFIEEIINRPKE